jgi:hypothetical protein
MFTICEGKEAPTSACRVIDVGETDSACADVRAEKIRRVRRHRNRLAIRDWLRIRLLSEA